MIQYRTAIIGRRKDRNKINNMNQELEQAYLTINALQSAVNNLTSQVNSLTAQVNSLQQQLQDAQDLATLRYNIIQYKNNYIQTLQTILDNNGIPYPPEPVYPQ